MPVNRLPVTLVCAAVAMAVGLAAPLEIASPPGAGLTLVATKAQAQTRGQVRRTARRTARRTTRRYVNTLPAGCVKRGVYFYCGGVYYAAEVQGGNTVYVIVNP